MNYNDSVVLEEVNKEIIVYQSSDSSDASQSNSIYI